MVIPTLAAVIAPLLLIPPPTELLSTVMPFSVGALVPLALIVPALLTVPVTVKLLWTLMQLTVVPLGLLTVAAVPGPVRVMAQLSAKADVELPPMMKAKIEPEASNTLRPANSNADYLHFKFQFLATAVIEMVKLICRI